jgi:hypothetical protein
MSTASTVILINRGWRPLARLPPARLLWAGRTRAQRLRLLAKLIMRAEDFADAQWEELNEEDPEPVASFGDASCTSKKSFRNFAEMRAWQPRGLRRKFPDF